MGKVAEAIKRMVDLGNYEKLSTARLERVKTYCQRVSPMNLTCSET